MTTDRQRAAAWSVVAAACLLAASGLVLSYWVRQAPPASVIGATVRGETLVYPTPKGHLGRRLHSAWQQVRSWSGLEPELPSARGARAARALRDSKDNAFFDRQTFGHNVLEQQPHAVEDLTAYLEDTAPLQTLPSDVDYSRSRPALLTERMAAIDLLQDLAGHPATHNAAVEALTRLFGGELPSSKPAKRLLMAEKYDILAALTRVDTDRAFAVYTSLENPKMADLLEDALVVGLVDTGVPRGEAVDLVRQSRHRAD